MDGVYVSYLVSCRNMYDDLLVEHKEMLQSHWESFIRARMFRIMCATAAECGLLLAPLLGGEFYPALYRVLSGFKAMVRMEVLNRKALQDGYVSVCTTLKQFHDNQRKLVKKWEIEYAQFLTLRRNIEDEYVAQFAPLIDLWQQINVDGCPPPTCPFGENACPVCTRTVADGLPPNGIVISGVLTCKECVWEWLKTAHKKMDVYGQLCVVPMHAGYPRYTQLDAILTALGVHPDVLALKKQEVNVAKVCAKGDALAECRKNGNFDAIIKQMENAMTLKCPHCGTSYGDYVGCDSVTCVPADGVPYTVESFCGGKFCGICGKPAHLGEDLHPHIQECRHTTVTRLISLGILPPTVNAGFTSYTSPRVKDVMLKYHQAQAITRVAHELSPPMRAAVLAFMVVKYPELAHPGYGLK